MPCDENLVARVRKAAARRGFVEKRMFGGVCFLLAGNICVGVWKDSLIVRVGAARAASALAEAGVGEFDVTGRPMKGWVLVGPEAASADAALRSWIADAVAFVRTLPAK